MGRASACQSERNSDFSPLHFAVLGALLLLLAIPALAATPTIEIKVDQVGYLSGAPKVALVASKTPAKEFTVRRAAGDVAFRAPLPPPVDDADSGDRVQAADFTALTTPGKYYLDIAGVGRSWQFAIGPDIYDRAWYLAMRSYYGMRCGTAVDLGPEFPGFRHATCHLEGAWHPSSGKTGPRASQAGWHDAGDYGRYIVDSGITTGTLLWTWEMFAPVRGIKLNLPETGNGTPDILNEIRWNLEWMLTMQDEDGGVWQKQTSEGFPGFIMPENDKLMSYVIGSGAEPFKTSCATGDLAAVMAIAARAYKPFDAAFAAKNLRAAEQAWTWLAKFPNVRFHNPKPVVTGEYGDANCADEALWAAAELFRTTGGADYQKYFLEHYAAFNSSIRATQPPEGWNDVANLGLWTYVLGGGKDAQATAAIRQASLTAADQVVDRTKANAYRNSMTSRDYVWGSNGVAANYGMQLLVANALQPKPAYVEAALDNLHYLLGRNAFSLSWVTQVGENPYRHPHHRPSGGDTNAEPWPGLLSGGPNAARQDAATHRLPPTTPPAKCYLDEQDSYASNEVAINWNAPLVFLLAGVSSAK